MSHTWTLTSDFDQGFKVNLDDVSVADQLQLYPRTDTRPLPYLWVPGSSSGTVYRINTNTLKIEGRYRCGPSGATHGLPSRTSVDEYGNCWVANRTGGAVVRYGLVVGGTRCDSGGNANADGD